ncbi:MAG: hypothetical protein JRF63_06660 [Deltaproteobacteria bacterium]|nr:hypothetical protein [Deltaproteobacteria bacterium]
MSPEATTAGRASPTRKKVIGYIAFVLWCFSFAYFSDYNWPTGTGNLCLILFLAANVYIPAKRLRKHYRFRRVQHYFDWLLKSHCYLNTAAFVMALVHCYTTSWANFWLWISLVLMGVLTVNGFVMKLRYPPKLRKGLYVLHSQQVVFFCLLYVMLKGHYVFPWLPP